MAGVIVDHEVAEGGVILRSGVTVAGVIVDYNVTVRCGYAVGGAFAVDSMATGAEAVVGGDTIVGGGMIVAVDDGVAQELAHVIGADCRAKYGSAPDNVVVDGQSYVPVLPPGS